MTTILAGTSGKPFKILTDLLTSRSPYFRELFGVPATRRSSIINAPTTTTAPSIPEASDATLHFPELNEFAFALFNRWLYGAQLSGPTDFHSMQHYLGLYVLASRFQIEKLENEVMDLTRAYYRATDLSSPPYRLEYIYENTSGPSKMREFLVATAAQRVIADGGMGGVMRDVLAQGGELTVDFIEALVKVQTEESPDVRRGRDCSWHNHGETRKCHQAGEER
jgi:hypothetical protein